MKCKCGKKMQRLDCKREVWFCKACGLNYDGQWRRVFCDDAHAHSEKCMNIES
jgi:hypothetical protein